MQSHTQKKSEELSETDLMILNEEFARFVMSSAHIHQHIKAKQTAQPGSNVKQSLTPREKKIQLLNQELMPFNQEYFVEEAESAELVKRELRSCRMCSENCRNTCEFYKSQLVENIYICKESGRLHYCSSVSCNALVTNAENRVCTLTGISYTLDVYQMMTGADDFADFNRREVCFDEDQLEQQVEQHNQKLLLAEKDTKEESQQQQPKPRMTVAVLAIITYEDTLKDQEPPAAQDPYQAELRRLKLKSKNKPKVNHKNKRCVTHHKGGIVARSTKAETLFCEARCLIRKLVPVVDADVLQRLCGVCVHLWFRFSSTSLYREIKGRYKFRNHVAALLYNSLDGIAAEGLNIMEPEPSLYELLPPAKHLKHFVNVKPSAYTQTCRYLHLLISQIVHS